MINYPKNPRPFEVGEEVYDLLYNKLEIITDITARDSYPVEMGYKTCTLDGRILRDHNIRALYHLEELPLTITAEPPRPEIKKDTKVRVRDSHVNTWANRYATGEFTSRGGILCYFHGADSFSSDSQLSVAWRYYEIVEDWK